MRTGAWPSPGHQQPHLGGPGSCMEGTISPGALSQQVDNYPGIQGGQASREVTLPSFSHVQRSRDEEATQLRAAL